MKYFLIMQDEIARGVTGPAQVVKIVEDDELGRATMKRARNVAAAISGMNNNEPVQIAAVLDIVRAR